MSAAFSDGRLRAALVDYSRRLHAQGWVANHDGNISVRLSENRFLCTPTATSKAAVQESGLVVTDAGGARLSGGKPFSELSLHLAVYEQRPDVQAVVHAHPVTATGFAVAGLALDVPFLAEAVVSVGTAIPLVPTAAPGPAAAAALRPYARSYDVVLLGANGVLAWGSDLEQAYLRLELCEHLAKIALVARQLGGVQPLPQSLLPGLLEARRRAGLLREPAPAVEPATPDLATVIRQELLSVLKR